MNKIEKLGGLINDIDNNKLDKNTGKKLGFTIATITIFVALLVTADILLLSNSVEFLGVQ